MYQVVLRQNKTILLEAFEACKEHSEKIASISRVTDIPFMENWGIIREGV